MKSVKLSVLKTFRFLPASDKSCIFRDVSYMYKALFLDNYPFQHELSSGYLPCLNPLVISACVHFVTRNIVMYFLEPVQFSFDFIFCIIHGMQPTLWCPFYDIARKSTNEESLHSCSLKSSWIYDGQIKWNKWGKVTEVVRTSAIPSANNTRNHD